MTTQTISVYPSLSNFSTLSTADQIDVLSDTFANILFSEFDGVPFTSLSAEVKEMASALFVNELINADITISSELFQAIESEGMYTNMLNIIRKHMAATFTTEQINSELQIVKLSGQKFAVTKNSYTMPSGFALYHPVFGFLGFADSIAPYQPGGGKKSLQSILSGGGFWTFEGMKWWKPIQVNE
ncbi:hypothetical protein [Paenibacillus tianjinensis]|uniref:Gluconate 2-dehydrogenase subunit 3 n=1 Tax=Paenibacillus tianjinensis TaxID=2810347 RepID=A0ABX7L692_9BACL|nr:hypothetical protein [Paenibacillus tianjinensis]QSF43509.1 hypothetical protein JRJ22_19800 [Paenibacillus tianjinensis]